MYGELCEVHTMSLTLSDSFNLLPKHRQVMIEDSLLRVQQPLDSMYTVRDIDARERGQYVLTA